jgi:hypothetical protein
MSIVTSAARTTALGNQVNNPLVAWDNLAATALVFSDEDLPDGSASNAITGTTYDYWLPNVTGSSVYLQARFPTAIRLSFAAIAAHNLGTLGASIALEYYSLDTFTFVDSGAGVVTPTDDSPIAFRVATDGPTSADWRLNITGLTASDPLYIGVAFFGNDLVIPQRLYQGFTPVIVPTEVQLQSNVSVGGNLLGSSVIAEGSTLSLGIDHLTPAFIRGALFKSFMTAFNRGGGFFVAWRPSDYAQDIHYAWRDGAVIRPTNSGPRDFMSFGIDARVYSE